MRESRNDKRFLQMDKSYEKSEEYVRFLFFFQHNSPKTPETLGLTLIQSIVHHFLDCREDELRAVSISLAALRLNPCHFELYEAKLFILFVHMRLDGFIIVMLYHQI